MKTITGLFMISALIVPSRPAAAQDLEYQIQRIVNSALTLAADALGDAVDSRQGRVDRQDRGRGDRGPEYTDTVNKTVRVGRNGRLELANFSGDVEITGGGGDDVKIAATKSTHSTNEANARAALTAMQIDIVERPGSVSVNAQPTQGRSNSVEINYVITVPTGTALSLRTYSGDVMVKNVAGDIRLKSLSGDVVIADAKPSAVDIEVTSGDISLEQIESEQVRAASLSGDIIFKGKLSKTGHYELRSNSGDIQVITDNSASFYVEASTFSGDVSSDFALTLPGAGPSSFAGNRGPRRGNDVRGTVKDGGATLSLRSLSGDIQLTKR